MKLIRQRVCFLAIASVLGLLTSVFILFDDASQYQIYMGPFLIGATSATVCLFGFLIWVNRKLKTARLIIENQILHIQPAIIDTGTCDSPIGGIEIIISCFGILLGSRVIKFNLDGVKLKAVEIGGEFICLTYGAKDKQTQKIKILHGAIDGLEMQRIGERFRYETGVVPIIKDL